MVVDIEKRDFESVQRKNPNSAVSGDFEARDSGTRGSGLPLERAQMIVLWFVQAAGHPHLVDLV